MSEQDQLDDFVELRKLVKEHIVPEYDWYKSHTAGPRLCFRVAGIVVVIGSLLLPVIAAAKGWSHREATLTILSLAVAILSSLSTFFKWELTWQSRIRTAKDLKFLLARWELTLRSANATEHPTATALVATQKLFDEAFAAIGTETKQFFSTIRWPTLAKPD